MGMKDIDNSYPNFEENSDWTSKGMLDKFIVFLNGGKMTSFLIFIGSDEQS